MTWTGSAVLSTGAAAFVGAAGDNQLHRHYATQWVIAERVPVQVMGEDGVVARGGVILCPAGVSHRLVTTAPEVGLLYAEPTFGLGRLASYTTIQVLEKSANVMLFQRLTAAVATQDADALHALIETFTGPLRLRATETTRIRSLMESPLMHPLPPPLAVAARHAGCSPSRFSHQFSTEMGIAYRAFVKWRKLLAAIGAISQGQDFTTAAHAGGFADSAHFSRTFKAMFGMAPSRLFAELTLAEKR